MRNPRSLINAGWRVASSPVQRREFCTYLRYVTARNRWLAASKAAAEVISGGVGAGPLLANISSASGAPVESSGTCRDFPVQVARTPEQIELSSPLVIRLASVELDRLTPPWEQTFEDPEDTFAAHRFGWMLPLLASRFSSELVSSLSELAIRWANAHPFATGAEGWDSYSISERIVNWIYLLSLLDKCSIPNSSAIQKFLCRSLEAQASLLSERLELRGAATNNHLLNNGRALYFAGAFTGKEQFQSQGREILRYGLRQMFTSSGFLREGSSHYHILLCRTYLEVFRYAHEIGDLGFADELKPSVRDQVNCAAFLLSHSTLPLIGDVSPDFRPDFHSGVVAVGAMMMKETISNDAPAGAGWHSLFGVKSVYGPIVSLRKPKSVVTFPDAGYYCVEWPPIKLTIYLNTLGYVPAWSHGHADLGGFIFEWNGQPVLVDCGRSTYQANKFGRYGRSVRSHNAISIDRHEPCIVHAHNGFIPPMLSDYHGPAPVAELEQHDDLIRLRIRYFGFRRLQPQMIVSRSFEVSRERFQIVDDIDGIGRHTVDTFFHLHPTVQITAQDNDGATLQAGETKLSLSGAGGTPWRLETFEGQNDDEPIGWFSPRYGVLRPTVTLRWLQNSALPVRNKYTVSLI